MLELPGYTTGQQVQTDSGTLLYRGRRLKDERPVIIKIIGREFPDLRDTLRLRNEFEIARSLHDVGGIVTPLGLENFGNGLALVLEDYGGVALGSLLEGRVGDLEFFFQVAIPGTSTLGTLHRNRVVHKDLRPETILVHPDTGEVRITNFGIASRIAREVQAVTNPEALEGALPYISPEQTGRMNRSIDFRSDFYSLGVLLYQVLTGRPPFVSEDPLELIHSHIAHRPTSPEDAGTPRALAQIVMKLLAKTPEERYQSAAGILADLETCARQYEVAGDLRDANDFVPGGQDVPTLFQIPQKLYGRDPEVQLLLDDFDRSVVDGAPRLLLVAGYSGIGKSALVRELHKPLLERRGYFVAGKFDQNRRDVPCWAVVQALQEFIRQALTERPERIQHWKKTMLEAVGSNGQVIVELIPELEWIIGPQPAVERLAPRESQNRFNTVFRAFIRALAGTDRPLAIFLDDLQWADLASFELIKLLLTDSEISSLFVIGAYRSNEVDATHPLHLVLEELSSQNVSVETIELAPLSENTIAEILTDALYAEARETRPLAELVRMKTDGNPFFMGEFLKSLYAEGLISLDHSGRRWRWSLRRIRELDITENVVDLMTRRILGLNNNAKQLLKLCACLGNRFDMRVLALTAGQSISRTAVELEEALSEGLILAVDETYKYLAGYDQHSHPETDAASETLQVICKFSHDRVQQAAYALLSDAEKESLHYEIGNRLLANANEDSGEIEDLTDIVSHLNAGVGRVAPDERKRLAELNLLAGLKAKNATAYDAALNNFKTGIDLLPASDWSGDYELSFALHENLLEAAYLTGDEVLMDRTEALLQNKARAVTDLVKTCEIRMTYFTGKNQPIDAVHTALAYLRSLGLRLPRDPGPLHVYASFLRTRLRRGRKSIASLAQLPPCADSRILAIQRICTIAIPPALIAGTSWQYILSMINVRNSIRYGNSVDSSYCYGIYGFLQCARLRDFDRGFAFGELGVNIAENSENRSLLPKTWPAQYYFTWHHKRPLRRCFGPLLEGYRLALEYGDFEYVGWNTYFYTYANFLSGQPLSEMRDLFARFIFVQQKYRHTAAENFMRPGAQLVANLLGESDQRAGMEGEIYSETKMLPQLEVEHPSAAFHGHLMKTMLAYLFGDYFAAIRSAECTAPFAGAVPAMPVEPLHYFYAALSHFAACDEARGWRRRRYRAKARMYARRLKKFARSSPENYLHKLLLLQAEDARLSGKLQRALKLYDAAGRRAREQEFIQEAAIAAERAGFCCLAANFAAPGRDYLLQALHDFERWGAISKVAQLRERFEYLRTEQSAADAFHPGVTPELVQSGGAISQAVDLSTLIEAAQTISGEIVLEELLKKMLVLVAENAGASRACLILYEADRDRWNLRAAYNAELVEAQSTDAQHFILWDDLPLEESGGDILAVAPVRFTIRTRETLLLDNAVQRGDFTRDPFIAARRIPSILCLPLINQDRIAGVLYLENSLAEGAFTSQRTKLLSLLSTQMAISIENALSYENKRRVEELMELDRLKNELFANISHEFRTPLTLILSPINDLIAAGAGDQRLLHMIQRSAHNMLRLVNHLLDIARAEAGGMTLRRQRIELQGFLRETAALFESPAKERGLRLLVSLPDTAVFAVIDPVVMERVLLNLISNALKYTARGEVELSLKILEGDRLRVTVRDTGAGMPSAILAGVFQRFFNSEERAAQNWVPGSGIGLAFAKEMVELHAGTLEVESREGEGSEFRVEFPREAAGAATEAERNEGARAQSALEDTIEPPGQAEISRAGNRIFREGVLVELASDAESPAPPPNGGEGGVSPNDFAIEKSERILIVEDEPDLQRYLSAVFSTSYQIDIVDNLAGALDHTRRRRPDLVLCDIMLAGAGDGYDYLRLIRGDPRIADTAVILLTARDDAQSRLAGLSYGADDYITKPFHTDELSLRVRNLLHRRRVRERERSRTRENLYSDLHDHLGGYLTDLNILADRLDVPAETKLPILHSIRAATRSLSETLQYGEDLKALSADFADGLQLILLRRYQQHERPLRFFVDDRARDVLNAFQGATLTQFYGVLLAVLAKELRRGSQESLWRLTAPAGVLRMEVRAGGPAAGITEIESADEEDIAIQLRALGGRCLAEAIDGTQPFSIVLELPPAGTLEAGA